jgi:predicted dehydrogenase
MNQGIHQVDLLAWFMGDPVAVTADALTLKRQVEVEDTLCASLRFANGALAAINATVTTAPGFPPRMEIYGTRGGVQIEGDTMMRWWSEDGPREEDAIVAQPSSAGAGADPRGISTAGHISIISDFIRALHEKRAPLVDGNEGRRSLSIVVSIYQAAGRIPGAASSQ